MYYVPRGARTEPLARRNDVEADWDELADVVLDEIDPRFGGTTASGTDPIAGESPAERIADWLAIEMLAFMKFFNPRLPEDHPENFYMEREWRSVRSIRFSLSDIARVYVAAGFASHVRDTVPDVADRVIELPRPESS